jgi:hypothetical protein
MGVYTRQFCWHEEWAVRKVVAVIQQEITNVEKQMTEKTNPTDLSLLNHSASVPPVSTSNLPPPEPRLTSTSTSPVHDLMPDEEQKKKDEEDDILNLHINVWEDQGDPSWYCTKKVGEWRD